MYYSEIEGLTSNPYAIIIYSVSKIFSHFMYSTLHTLDSFSCDEIVIETPPQTESWSAILDRLQKACY